MNTPTDHPGHDSSEDGGGDGVPVAVHAGRGLPLAAVAHGHPPHGRIRLIGRLDPTTMTVLHETLTGLHADGFRVLVLDLTDLTDVTGLATPAPGTAPDEIKHLPRPHPDTRS